MRKPSSSVGLALFGLILGTSIGCGGRQPMLAECAIERPNLDVILEQIDEAERASEDRPFLLDEVVEGEHRVTGGHGAVNPATYEWLKRVDRDINLFGDDD